MTCCVAALLAAALVALAIPTRAAPAPAEGPWNDYHIIMWQKQSPAGEKTLARIGVDAESVSWRSTKDLPKRLTELRAAGLGWYYENVATDFYAPYHRWTPDKPVNWRFLETKKRYRANPNNPTAFFRLPSLSDPVWLDRIRDRLTQAVKAASGYPPLFYNLGDESGIADNGSYWDFDLSPPSLAGMRVWLKEQYGSLATLNREWGTKFAHWDDVMPETTSQAFARTDHNFAAWGDFKAWMDTAFARAFRTGTEAVHAANPHARTALEGGQIPGWGGYDYAKLAGAVDVMELYDYAQNVDIVRSLAPATVLLSTMGSSGPAATHRIWNLLLRGERGVILWDPKNRYVGKDSVPGPRAKADRALFHELKGGLGALVIGSVRYVDPVAILYSPPSFRMQWMLDVKPTGAAWAERTPDSEYEDNAVRAARRGYFDALGRLGIAPYFISPGELASGVLEKRRAKVLVLPHVIALSAEGAAAVRQFAKSGGIVVADTVPGTFDAHGKRRKKPALSALFAAESGSARLVPIARHDAAALMALLSPTMAAAGITPAVAVHLTDGTRPADVATYAFQDGDVTLIALQRARPNGDVDRPLEPMMVDLQAGSHVTDLMARKSLGQHKQLRFSLGTAAPAIYAVSRKPIPDTEISAPTTLRPGAPATIRIRRQTVLAAMRPFHVEVIGPNGEIEPRLSGNLLVTGKTASWTFTLPADAPAGAWSVRVTDLLAGKTRDFEILAREAKVRP